MTHNADTWVVYEKMVRRQPIGQNAVCKQAEWDEMERIQPGCQTLAMGPGNRDRVRGRLLRANGPGPRDHQRGDPIE